MCNHQKTNNNECNDDYTTFLSFKTSIKKKWQNVLSFSSFIPIWGTPPLILTRHSVFECYHTTERLITFFPEILQNYYDLALINPP